MINLNNHIKQLNNLITSMKQKVNGTIKTKVTTKNAIWNPRISQLATNRSVKKSLPLTFSVNVFELLRLGQKVKFLVMANHFQPLKNCKS